MLKDVIFPAEHTDALRGYVYGRSLDVLQLDHKALTSTQKRHVHEPSFDVAIPKRRNFTLTLPKHGQPARQQTADA